jgi:antitoxin PrlF
MARDAPSWDQRNTFRSIAFGSDPDVGVGLALPAQFKRFGEISGLRIVGELLLSCRKSVFFRSNTVATKLTAKGQVTIPKHIRDAIGLRPGQRVEFRVGENGTVVIQQVKDHKPPSKDRFAAARGIAKTKLTTDQLMALLRG